jgi:hypothetical protein
MDGSKINKQISLPVPHIHMLRADCKPGRDGIFGKSGTTYYACIGGNEVCSLASGKHAPIPAGVIAAYEAALEPIRQNHAVLQQERVAAGRSTGDPRRDHEIAMLRSAFVTAEVARQRAAGQRPNLGAIREAAERAYPMKAGNVASPRR